MEHEDYVQKFVDGCRTLAEAVALTGIYVHELTNAFNRGRSSALEEGEMVLDPVKQRERFENMFTSGGIVDGKVHEGARLPLYGEVIMSKRQFYELGKCIGRKNPRKSMTLKAFKRKVRK